MAKTGHCVHVTTISQALYKSSLHGGVARRKPFPKKPTLSPIWRMYTTPEILNPCGKSFVVWRSQGGTFWPKCKTLRLVQTQHSTSPKEHHPDGEAWWWQQHVMGMFLISRDWDTWQNTKGKWMKQNTEKSERKTCCPLQESKNWMKVHLSAWQRPDAPSQSYTGVAKE